jgi:SAM-dependent methyltransferase
MSLPARPEYVGGGYGDVNADWHEEDARWKASEVARILDANGLRPQRICDIGCGTGGVLDELGQIAPYISEMVGFEVSDRATRLAPARRTERVTFCIGDPPVGAHFDVALMLDVLEHVEDYFGLLRARHELADRFVFHIPLDISVASVLRARQFGRLRQNVGHIHYFTRETALATLQDAGYRVIDYNVTAPGIDRPSSTLQRVFRVPRWLAYHLNAKLAVRLLGGFSLCVLAE